MSSVWRSTTPRLSQSSKTPNKGSESPCTCTWTTLPTHASTHDGNPPLSAMRKPPSGIFYHREHYLIFGHSPKCLERLSEKGKRSLPCSLTEHQNGTFRPIFASQHVQIRTQSVVRTPFRTVSEEEFSEVQMHDPA